MNDTDAKFFSIRAGRTDRAFVKMFCVERKVDQATRTVVYESLLETDNEYLVPMGLVKGGVPFILLMNRGPRPINLESEEGWLRVLPPGGAFMRVLNFPEPTQHFGIKFENTVRLLSS